MYAYLSWNSTAKMRLVVCLYFLETIHLYVVCFEWIFLVDVAWTQQQLSGKLSKLRLSVLCNYGANWRKFSPSMCNFYFLRWNTVLKKGSEVTNKIKLFFCYVCLHVLKLHGKNSSHSIFIFSWTIDFYVVFWVKIRASWTDSQFSGKLSELWLSFLLCNYMTYRRIIIVHVVKYRQFLFLHHF